jgi:hypothetical protein
LRKPLLRFLDHSDRYIHIDFLLHNPVMKNKAMLIFDNAHQDTQFDRHPRFSFADPFGIRFKNGKDFFWVRNLFALNNPAINLIDLSPGMIIVQDKIR